MEFSQTLFKISAETTIGQHVRIVGDHPKLGSWNPALGLVLYTTPNIYPYWVSKELLELERGIFYLFYINRNKEKRFNNKFQMCCNARRYSDQMGR